LFGATEKAEAKALSSSYWKLKYGSRAFAAIAVFQGGAASMQ
jgi:hypothetical protein